MGVRTQFLLVLLALGGVACASGDGGAAALTESGENAKWTLVDDGVVERTDALRIVMPSELEAENGLVRPVSQISGDLPFAATRLGGTESLAGRDVVLVFRGQTVRGTVESDDGESIQLRFRTESGAMGTTTVRYDQLDPRTRYGLSDQRTRKDDGEGQLGLAEFALANGMHAAALQHFMQAGAADAALTDQVEDGLNRLQATAGQDRLARARKALERGQYRQAEAQLAGVAKEFEGTDAGAEAQAALDDVLALPLGKRRGEWSSPEEVDQQLRQPAKLVEEALGNQRAGISSGVSQSASIRELKRSRTKGQSALKRLNKLARDRALDEPLRNASARLEQHAVEGLIDTELHLARVYAVRSDYQNALGCVDRALALDPDNERALKERERIRDAIEYSDDWGRRYRPWQPGIGVPTPYRRGGRGGRR